MTRRAAPGWRGPPQRAWMSSSSLPPRSCDCNHDSHADSIIRMARMMRRWNVSAAGVTHASPERRMTRKHDHAEVEHDQPEVEQSDLGLAVLHLLAQPVDVVEVVGDGLFEVHLRFAHDGCRQRASTGRAEVDRP